MAVRPAIAMTFLIWLGRSRRRSEMRDRAVTRIDFIRRAWTGARAHHVAHATANNVGLIRTQEYVRHCGRATNTVAINEVGGTRFSHILGISRTDSGRITWLPIAEVQSPAAVGPTPSLSLSTLADEIIFSAHDGTAMRWRIGAAEPIAEAPPRSQGLAAWQSSCATGSEQLVHLAAKPGASAMDLELFVSVLA